jgi:hypothetical protein
MKPTAILIAAALAGTALWLGFRQVRVEQKVAKLEAENQEFAQEVANRFAATPEGGRETQSRLKETQLALDLAERRLSNLTAQLEDLQRQVGSPPQAVAATSPAGHSIAVEQRLPASSHSPSGELLNRSWGPEQALGPPNTPAADDTPSAWAAREPDGGEEWLKLEFDTALDLAEIRVRETFNPGAIARVTAFHSNGREVTVWEGREPRGQAPLDIAFPVNVSIRASSVKIYLDTRRVPGWNEIDAVELVGRDGTRQWVTAATASSTYAEW